MTKIKDLYGTAEAVPFQNQLKLALFSSVFSRAANHFLFATPRGLQSAGNLFFDFFRSPLSRAFKSLDKNPACGHQCESLFKSSAYGKPPVGLPFVDRAAIVLTTALLTP